MANQFPVLVQSSNPVVIARENLTLGSDGQYYLTALPGPPGRAGQDSLSTHTVERTVERIIETRTTTQVVERLVPVFNYQPAIQPTGTPTVARATVGEPVVSEVMVTKAVQGWLANKDQMEVFKLTSEPGMLKYRPPVAQKTVNTFPDTKLAAPVKVVRH